MAAWKTPIVTLAAWHTIGLAGATLVLAQSYPVALRYLPRVEPPRQEGLAAEPKSADAIVLVSALADVKGGDAFEDWPAEFHLRFYLPPGQPAPDIRIRQLRSLTGYYMMDSVAPVKPWAPEAVNDFSWTRDVVAQVYEYQVPPDRRAQITKGNWLAGLGVVIGLGPAGAGGSLQQAVAPAVLASSNRPVDVLNYLFTFRTNFSSEVTGKILSAGAGEVFSGLKYDVTSGSPFTIRWPAADRSEGWYRLVLDPSRDGQPQVVVRFYHKRALRGPG